MMRQPYTLYLVISIFGITALVLLAVFSIKSSQFSTPLGAAPSRASQTLKTAAYRTQENSEGNVMVSISPLMLSSGQNPTFKISFNTHSVGLDFDVASIALLADGSGLSYPRPTWDGSPPGGHHRNGTLTFTQPLSPTATKVRLTLRNIAGIAQREFMWEVSQP